MLVINCKPKNWKELITGLRNGAKWFHFGSTPGPFLTLSRISIEQDLLYICRSFRYM